MLTIFNTLSKQKEEFKPIEKSLVKMYSCGLTVYDYPHIGNLRSFTMADIIRRVFEFNDYDVIHVMNFTDVGHLVGDGNTGEDKVQKGAHKMHMTVWEVAQHFIDYAQEDFIKMNFLKPEYQPRATDHIYQQIEMIKTLINGGFAYETSQAVYYDTSRFENYSELSGQNLNDKKVGVRDEVEVDTEKRNPADFRLWQKAVGVNKHHTMQWISPWGPGFPGWHIECSAMAKVYLGNNIDIHTGGVDHIPVHHTNEIAQSEAANDEKFVNYWYHNEFLKVDGKKMSKSLGNFYTLSDLGKKGYSPLVLRYFFFTANFRKAQNLTFEGLDSAKVAYEKLKEYTKYFKINYNREIVPLSYMETVDHFKKFKAAINDSFDMPVALSAVWGLMKDKSMKEEIKFEILKEFDRVLGLKL